VPLTDDELAETVCQFAPERPQRGRSAKMCSYLMPHGEDWECAKRTAFEPLIRARRIIGAIKAMGDNCSGPPHFEPTSSNGRRST
jgi:hypothetical protein